MDALARSGANQDLIDLVKVPGSWEVPLVAGDWRGSTATTRLSA